MITVIYSFLTALSGGFVGWFFKRKIVKVNLESTEIDNAVKNAKYYQNLLDDMVRRHKEALNELEKATATIKAKDNQIQQLMESIHELTEELKKYKQLNGKS